MRLEIRTNLRFAGAEHDQFSVERNMGLIQGETYKLHRRFLAAGMFHFDYEDALQMALMKFTHAETKFNRQLGNRFSTYYVSAMRNLGNIHVDRHMNSLRASSIEELREVMNADADVYEVISSEVSGDPFDSLSRMEEAERKLRRLSVRGRFVVACLVDPPVELRKAYEAQRSHAALCRAQGEHMRVSKDIDLAFIARFYQISRGDVESIKEELRKTVEDASLWHHAGK